MLRNVYSACNVLYDNPVLSKLIRLKHDVSLKQRLGLD
jgi:hypothetical protein